ncbi:hypothetical protein AVEN_163058-1 [Araneus ventricosus]|uniref:Uncharacterized protein n=1 Tax=Araneus ventricosus TaxID=182803 RepID=A0A4Y2J8Z4_ARAVE|nr:hypothetical protein AVEN_163058-1 [Araneus ventricosus]
MTSAVLDFEGFQISPGRFIVKELAVCAVNEDTFCGRWLFKPPHSFKTLDRKRQNTYTWITKFLHHIAWDDGGTMRVDSHIRNVFLYLRERT